jgi:hypothetical protein
LLGREQNTVEINTDGGERDPLAADFFVLETQPARSIRHVCAPAHVSKLDARVKQIQTADEAFRDSRWTASGHNCAEFPHSVRKRIFA